MTNGRLRAGACAALLVLAGCAAPSGTVPVAPGAVSPPAASPTPTRVAPTDLPASVPASPGATLAVLPDPRTGAELDKPFTYRGVVLLNQNHPVSKEYVPKVDEGHQLTPEADRAFGRMLKAAQADGVNIIWRVGYRSYAIQAELAENPPSVYGDDADRYVARPGRSEHQAGLAVDVASKAGYGTRFPETREFAWLRANSYRYGFILRYPEGKTAITGLNYEPWHYRYIGPAAAAAFGPNSTLTLEEYLGGR